MTSKTIESIGQMIDKEKWLTILQRFIDVLQVNIFIVDNSGRPYLMPNQSRFGWKFLSQHLVGSEIFNGHANFLLEKFRKQGNYLEYNYPFSFHCFAVPIELSRGKLLGYIVIGPLILNKRLDRSDYETIAINNNLNFNDFMDAIAEIKVLSFLQLRSILDLLYEFTRHSTYLTQNRKKSTSKTAFTRTEKQAKIDRWTRELSVSAYGQEVLETLLEAALKMTKTQSGSIMIVDHETGELTVRLSRGMDRKIAQNTKIKIGEGIAGLAAKENTPFVIQGNQTESRLRKYLKRPEIKQSYVMPLSIKNRVFGVLNLSTKEQNDQDPRNNLDFVKELSRLTSVAMQSVPSKSI